VGKIPQHHDLFFLDQLSLWKFSVWAAAMALYSSYLIDLFFFFRSAFLFLQQFDWDHWDTSRLPVTF
jgi:hypothetical protein